MKVYLVDGTYELFRQYFGRQRQHSNSPLAATAGVVASVVSLLADGATHVGVATDHVIESFRNDLWPGYKTSAGVPEDLLGQFEVVERALECLGVALFAMVEREADDALASAAAVVGADPVVEQVVICTPDKDLAQCVVDDRVVQWDRRAEVLIDEAGVWAKFGVAPESIPDWLALVGDSADGFPGLPGWGKSSASAVLAHYRHLDAVPDDVADWDPELRRTVRRAPALAEVLASGRSAAELFLELATLRVDPPVIRSVGDLAWRGPTPDFPAVCEFLGEPSLSRRAAALRPAP